MRSWIRLISFQEASGRLRKLYERISPTGKIDNILLAHGLRPHTLEGHLALYKSVLHHARNTLAPWLLEAIGVYVSLLNGCRYCVEHHARGLERLLDDDARAAAIRAALERDAPEEVFEGLELAALRYARALTLTPSELTEEQLEGLRAAGLDDGEILEINQVTSYFAYANRTVLGLGVTTEGDVLGLSPRDRDDPGSWRHS